MKFYLSLEHWQLFSILIGVSILGFALKELYFANQNFTFLVIADLFVIISLFMLFGWVYVIGSFLNNIPDNPFHFNKVLYTLAFIFCIYGYGELGVQSISGLVDDKPGIVSAIITILTFWGVLYLYFKTSRSLKSIELNRKVKFSEHIFDAFLLFMFPIGIWIIQPKINALSRD